MSSVLNISTKNSFPNRVREGEGGGQAQAQGPLNTPLHNRVTGEGRDSILPERGSSVTSSDVTSILW